MAANATWKKHVRKAIDKIRTGKSTGIDLEKLEDKKISREVEKTITGYSKKSIKPRSLFPFQPGGFVLYKSNNRPSKAIVEYYGPNNPKNVKRNLMRRAKQQAGKMK